MKLILICLLFVQTISLMAQQAYIQVEAEPGISVFLDETFKGKTNWEAGGLIIENVSPGTHIIKVLKEGYNPQEDRITIQSGEVYSYKVRPFIPMLKISQTGNTGQQEMDIKVGKLKIQSLPITITISIPALRVNSDKSRDEWNVEEIPVGTYEATFKGLNKSLSYSIDIKHNQLTHLFVNMVSGKIENRTSEPGTHSGIGGSISAIQPLNYISVTDSRDGKTYKTIQIGNQVWMAENLSFFVGSGSWAYDNDPLNETIYGRLYNWETAQRVCLSGWHLPSDAEWTTLINNLRGEGEAGGKLKETGTINWRAPNKGASNESGFTARPGGYRHPDGSFGGIGYWGAWWSATEADASFSWTRSIFYEISDVGKNKSHWSLGYSVRCIRD